MLIIPFSYNWNNKLDCKAFTTIRIYNPGTHIPGMVVDVQLKGVSKGIAKIISVKPFYLHNLNEYMSYLDTGYAVPELKNIIEKMYPKIYFTTKKMVFILILKDVK